MKMKKIFALFLSLIFCCNCVFAADTLHIYKQGNQIDYNDNIEQELIYDFSDEAQEEFNRNNGQIVPKEKPVHIPFTYGNREVTQDEVMESLNNVLPDITTQQLKGRVLYVDAGSKISAMLNSSISSDSISNNDNISAQLTEDWIVNGIVIAREGSLLTGAITDANKASYAMKNGKIGFSFNRLLTLDGREIPLSTNVVYVVSDSSQTKNIALRVGGTILAGVALAAVVGLLGGGDIGSALWKGAAVGGALGAVSVAATKGEEIFLQEGSVLDVVLSEPMTIQAY